MPVSYLPTFQLDMGLTGLGLELIAAFIVMLGYTVWVFKRRVQAIAPWLHTEEYSTSWMSPLLTGLPIAMAALLEHGLIYGGT